VVGLVKSFGRTKALNGLNLSVAQGEVHGFLGPNGAGKTTTLRLLLGLLRADAGEMQVLGGDPWIDAVDLHRRLAYVPGDVALWPTLSGGEVIDLLGRLRGGLDPQRRDSLLERFELDTTKKGRTYSKGNRQKVALVAALASDVELLLLDEPTLGLDPLMEAQFRDYINEVRGDGRTVLLSSHTLSEVEALCDRVTIIREGGGRGGKRHDGPAAPPRADGGVGRSDQRARGPCRPSRRARRRGAGPTDLGQRGGHRYAGTDDGAERWRSHGPDQRAADARGAVPAPLPRTTAVSSELKGTTVLVRLALRRDRLLIPLWIGLSASMVWFSASATVDLYPNEAARIEAANMINSTASLVALYGPIYDPTSLGALSMTKMTAVYASLVSILMVTLVVRHTRAEEEAGRLELIGSGVVGRAAPMTAALLVVGGASAVLGVLAAAGLLAAGLPVVGSLIFGAG
jgi:ABC-type Na+ transport system ATPase subunit NatA